MSSSLAKSIAIAIRTGKASLGYKEALDAVRAGKAKLLVVAGNLPEEMRGKLVQAARFTETPILEFEASSLDLGVVCGKPYTVSALAIRDPGDSDILNLAAVKPAGRRRKRR